MDIFQSQNCQNCIKDKKCELCNDLICSNCSCQIEGELVCVPCSVSLRNCSELVEHFIKWHKIKLPQGVKITKEPNIVNIGNESVASAVQYEYSNVIGSISYRSDGQLDAEALDINTEKFIYSIYRVLVSKAEISEYLESLYEYNKAYNANCI